MAHVSNVSQPRNWDMFCKLANGSERVVAYSEVMFR